MSNTSDLLKKYSTLKQQQQRAAEVLDFDMLTDTSKEILEIENQIREISN